MSGKHLTTYGRSPRGFASQDLLSVAFYLQELLRSSRSLKAVIILAAGRSGWSLEGLREAPLLDVAPQLPSCRTCIFTDVD